MEINSVSALYFSPGGSTRSVARSVAGGISGEARDFDFTSRAEAAAFGERDLVIIAAPVFGGRIPEVFSRFLDSVSAKGAPAVVLAVYGLRAYDDALVELADRAKARGFRVIAAGAFIARHSMAPEIAAGRPDEADREAMAAFSRAVRDKLASDDLSEPAIPGNRPYKSYGGVPLHPSANRQRCLKCGKCARECPVGAIPADQPWKTENAKCITCMHCVFTCPNFARGLNPVLLAATRTKLKKACSAPRRPETYL